MNELNDIRHDQTPLPPKFQTVESNTTPVPTNVSFNYQNNPVNGKLTNLTSWGYPEPKRVTANGRRRP